MVEKAVTVALEEMIVEEMAVKIKVKKERERRVSTTRITPNGPRRKWRHGFGTLHVSNGLEGPKRRSIHITK